jgi:hypothetical protein
MNRQKRIAQAALSVSSGQPGADVYKMFLEELQMRRERLRELLQMVAIEAQKHSQASHRRVTCAKSNRAAA